MDELSEAELAGKEAADCIMPGLIASAIEPANDRLTEIAADHMHAHWQKLDDEGRFAAFAYLATVLSVIAAEKVTDALAQFAAGYDQPFTAAGWPIRTDGGL